MTDLSKALYKTISSSPNYLKDFMVCYSRIFSRAFCLCSSTTRLRLTKKQCTFLLQICKSIRQLKQIHCQVIMSNLHNNSDLMDDFLVLATDADAGDIRYASKVFDAMQDPSLFMHNLMIKAFAKLSLWKDAVLLFDRMREQRLSPDNFTYPFVLKALGSIKQVSKGRSIHGFIVKNGFEFDPYVRNSLMDMYAEMGSVEITRTLFDEMQKRELIAWNVMIGCYVKCEHFQDAVDVYAKMEEEGVVPDEITLVSTLSACASSGNLEVGKKIHHSICKRLWFTITLSNALLDMYAKCRSLDLARKYFDDMPAKNVISWTTIVSGYANSGKLEEARDLFNQCPTEDVILWTAMINGYVQYNKWDEALSMFREMQMKGIEPDKFTVVSLLTVCANIGALEQGRWIHGFIEDKRMKIDAVVGTALINMYAKCGFIDKSLEVFHRLEAKDTGTWTAIICGFAMNGKTNEALAMFKEKIRAGVQPDDITFIGVLSACSHGGLVDEGRQQFHAMQKVHKIVPKLEHYGCMVDLLGRAGLIGEALDLLKSVPAKDYEGALPLWGALLAACRIHGKVEIGELAAEQFTKQHYGNSGIYSLLANMYASADKWESVTAVRRRMRELGIKKTPGCSSIEVNGVVHEFLAGDTSHPEKDELFSISKSMHRMSFLDENSRKDNLLLELSSW